MISYPITTERAVDTVVAEAQLAKNKTALLSAKSAIADVVERYGQRAWDARTYRYELAYHVAERVRGDYGVPIDASNAFFKCIELLGFATATRLFDNASLPGDFIRAALWMFGPTLDWRANSLVGGLDDRYGLVHDNPARWMMSAGMNGDTTVPANCDAIVAALGDWRADLYTSDLGFAVQNYMCEEQEHYAAHAAQIDLGLRVLQPGGTLIVKMFTLHNTDTYRLLQRTRARFSEFYIVKPATSKADNSEQYWVGRGLLVEPVHVPLYPRSAINISTALTRRQKNKILQNVEMFNMRADNPLEYIERVDEWIAYHITRNLPQRV